MTNGGEQETPRGGAKTGPTGPARGAPGAAAGRDGHNATGSCMPSLGIAMPEEWHSVQEIIERLVPALAESHRIAQACAWLPRAGDRCDTCPHAQGCRDHALCLHRVVTFGCAEDDAGARMPLDALPETLVADGAVRLARGHDAGPAERLWDWLAGMRAHAADVWCFTAEGRLVALCALGHGRRGPTPAQLEPLRQQLAMHLAGARAIERSRAHIQRLQELGLRLAVNNERLRDALHARSIMLTNMSHELRACLNAVIGLSEVVRNGAAGEVTERQNAYLTTVISGGRRLSRLLEDMLDIAAVETGDFVLRAEPCIVARVLSEAVQSARPVAHARSVTLSLDLPGDDVVAVLDPARLRQLAVSLLSAAIRLSVAEGVVHLVAEVADGELVLRIRLQGPTPPLEEREALFEGLQPDTLDAEADDVSSGLRLALARRLAEAQGGVIEWTELSGDGSALVVRLPCGPPPEDQEAPADRRPDVAQPSAQGPVAVVVEQDVPSRIVLAQTAAAAGLAVVELADSDALLASVERLRPAVVVLGQARGGNALDASLRALRARDDGRDLPVVFVGHRLLCEQAMQVGVSATAGYPVDREQMTTLLRTLARPASEDAPMLALIVDDNPAYADAMAAIVEAAGIKAVKAWDGLEGLAMARRLAPDVILLDLMMPRANGLEVMRALQEQDDTRHIPVIVLTVKPLSASETDTLESLAAGVLPKAVFSPEAIHDALRDAGVDLRNDAS